METFHNKSKIKIFQDNNIFYLEDNVNEFMLTTKKIYNVKHNVIEIEEEGKHVIHFIMVSYE